MTSPYEPIHWTCPHCFAVEEWGSGKIDAHTCEGIREVTTPKQYAAARLDAMLAILNGPKSKEKKRG